MCETIFGLMFLSILKKKIKLLTLIIVYTLKIKNNIQKKCMQCMVFDYI